MKVDSSTSYFIPMADGTPPKLLKMSELARQSGVPSATIKHYLREGLLPAPSLKTGRNMAYYDEALVPRIKAIKELQRTQFLPLKVIREVLVDGLTEEVGDALRGALARISATPARSRAEVLAAGVSSEELDFFERIGIIRPQQAEQGAVYPGDDVALLRTLANARRAGLTQEMLPHTILGPYVTALRELVRVELSLFRDGVLPHADPQHITGLVEAATELSEHLVVLLRRRMLLPTLEELVREDAERRAKAPAEGPPNTKSKDTVRRARTRRTP